MDNYFINVKHSKDILGSNYYFVNLMLHQTIEFIHLWKKNMLISLGVYVRVKGSVVNLVRGRKT